MNNKIKAINSLQDIDSGSVYGNDNMKGPEDFIHALLMNQSVWPNDWGQDVAGAAYLITAREKNRKSMVEAMEAARCELVTLEELLDLDSVASTETWIIDVLTIIEKLNLILNRITL